MRTRLTFTLALLLAFSCVRAQRACGTVAYQQQRIQQDPATTKMTEKAEYAMQEWLRNQQNQDRAQATITIPVVVHVVYRTAAENISNAQILSQIDILNEDFGRSNADTVLTPAIWKNVAADTDIRFCLAARDPNGNLTTGITRTLTNKTSFSTNDDVKFNSTGGKDAWPRDDYLNIWVCNLGLGLVGYGQLPGQPAAIDGVVIGYPFFGRVGTVQPPFDKGRTTTHEVGHWLNLSHIWGDDNGACSGSDQVADTPNQADFNTGCPGYPTTDVCNSTGPGVMFMNYMDFTDDACMNMFTAGQGARMQACLATVRSSLAISQGCVPPNQVQLDAAVTAILAPVGTMCVSQITPELTLTNWGIDPITAVDINWAIDGGTPQSFAWSGSLASLASVNVTLPTQSVPNGNHTIVLWTSGPNGMSDGQPGNDSLSGNFSTTAQAAGMPVPFMETFENGNFPPSGWTINNPDNGLTWARNNSVGFLSSRSAWLNNFDYNSLNEPDDLILPPLDLTLAGYASLRFQLSYSLYSPSGFSDTLQVWISTDCGNSYTKVYEKFDQALTTASPYYLQSPYAPTGPSDWRTEIVSLAPYSAFSSVLIKFRNITDFENNLYLDDIFVQTATVAVEEDLGPEGIQLYPNPGSGRFSLEIASLEDASLSFEVLNTMGQVVHTESRHHYTGERIPIDLRAAASGIYFVRIRIGEMVVTRRLIKS